MDYSGNACQGCEFPLSYFRKSISHFSQKSRLTNWRESNQSNTSISIFSNLETISSSTLLLFSYGIKLFSFQFCNFGFEKS